MRGRVGRRKCQTSAGSKSFAVENEGRERAFSALRQRSGVCCLRNKLARHWTIPKTPHTEHCTKLRRDGKGVAGLTPRPFTLEEET